MGVDVADADGAVRAFRGVAEVKGLPEAAPAVLELVARPEGRVLAAPLPCACPPPMSLCAPGPTWKVAEVSCRSMWLLFVLRSGSCELSTYVQQLILHSNCV
mmetsp:Transcript_13076/g.31994  ORF Transcript_13076/g.31994 Transcript_13076/m.31994 type:complete len:102 (-) Transcript_13076:224-529(-)